MASEPPAEDRALETETDAANDVPSRTTLLDRANVRDQNSEAASTANGTAEPAGPEQAVNGTSDREKVHQRGLAEFYGMRLTWSYWLIGWVTALLVFQVVLTLAIGVGALDFEGYDLFLGLTVGQNFVQVVAMAVIVVRFLHSRDKDAPPL